MEFERILGEFEIYLRENSELMMEYDEFRGKWVYIENI